MSVKTYLQDQIRLVSFSGYDLYTDEEMALYQQIIKQREILDKMEEEGIKEGEQREKAIKDKEKIKQQLENLIHEHQDKPRDVRLESVIYYPKNADYPFPEGVAYNNLKTNKKIAEFCCELSRAMGLNNLDRTLGLVVVKWKNIEVMHQLVVNGFNMKVITQGGIENKHYHFFTASAGRFGL